jgi:hypothetical protein
MDKDFNRLFEQSIDILIYDLNNKYQSLKLSGINKDNISIYMNQYQNNRIKDFTDDYSRIKSIYKKK